MKTIGLLGGMSWQSTQLYYSLINHGINQQLGKMHSAQILLYSVDFEPVEAAQHKGDWDKTEEILAAGMNSLKNGGADFVLICTNTMHKLYDRLQRRFDMPMIHVGDATASVVIEKGLSRVALLGTRFTMEQDFYKQRLQSKGLEVLIPTTQERDDIHRVIYEELCMGVIKAGSRRRYLDVINRLAHNGAQAVILGCTEIGMLVKQADTSIPVLDTTEIHAKAAIKRALNG